MENVPKDSYAPEICQMVKRKKSTPTVIRTFGATMFIARFNSRPEKWRLQLSYCFPIRVANWFHYVNQIYPEMSSLNQSNGIFLFLFFTINFTIHRQFLVW